MSRTSSFVPGAASPRPSLPGRPGDERSYRPSEGDTGVKEGRFKTFSVGPDGVNRGETVVGSEKSPSLLTFHPHPS